MAATEHHLFTKKNIHKALRKVQKNLANGKISKKEFDINIPMENLYENGKHCGSVGCIGGWAASYMGYTGHPHVSDAMDAMCAVAPELRTLFYSYRSDVTPRGAVSAIDRYFAGERIWK